MHFALLLTRVQLSTMLLVAVPEFKLTPVLVIIALQLKDGGYDGAPMITGKKGGLVRVSGC